MPNSTSTRQRVAYGLIGWYEIEERNGRWFLLFWNGHDLAPIGAADGYATSSDATSAAQHIAAR